MSINRCGPCKRSAKTHPHSRKSPRRLRRHSKIWEKQRAAHPRGAVVCLCAKTLAGKARGGCADITKYGKSSARPIPGVLRCAFAPKPWPEKPAAAAPT